MGNYEGKKSVEMYPVDSITDKFGAPEAKPAAPVCSNCGAAMKEGHAFCSKCGSPAEKKPGPAPAALVCSNCGAPMKEGHAFCSKCGHKACDFD